MKRFHLVLCILALLSPAAVGAQGGDEVWEDDAYDEYEEYFGRNDGAYREGPSSLAEAKKEGRGYRIGRGGVHSQAEPELQQGEVHVVQEGDTLWGITERYFEDPWKWPEVWAWNPEITNPHWIYPLDTVRLSARALEVDKALAAQQAGTPNTLPVEKAKVYRIGRGDPGGRMMVDRPRLPPGTIFLRDQGYLDREALKTAGVIASSAEEQMFLSLGDELYVTVPEGAETPKAGTQYTVFRSIKPEERVRGAKGELVRIYGSVQVRSYDPKKRIARCVIVESVGVIERGFKVAKVERRFDLVDPRKNGANVVTKIIASVRPVDLMSFGDVVFLDVGEGEGIQPGNRFFVVRRGDQWVDTLERSPESMGAVAEIPPHKSEELPKEVVAELRVIKVRKHTTIALVVRSDTDLQQGDIAEMRVGF